MAKVSSWFEDLNPNRFMLDDILDAISKHFGIEPEGDCDIKPKKKKGKGKKKKKK